MDPYWHYMQGAAGRALQGRYGVMALADAPSPGAQLAMGSGVGSGSVPWDAPHKAAHGEAQMLRAPPPSSPFRLAAPAAHFDPPLPPMGLSAMGDPSTLWSQLNDNAGNNADNVASANNAGSSLDLVRLDGSSLSKQRISDWLQDHAHHVTQSSPSQSAWRQHQSPTRAAGAPLAAWLMEQQPSPLSLLHGARDALGAFATPRFPVHRHKRPDSGITTAASKVPTASAATPTTGDNHPKAPAAPRPTPAAKKASVDSCTGPRAPPPTPQSPPPGHSPAVVPASARASLLAAAAVAPQRSRSVDLRMRLAAKASSPATQQLQTQPLGRPWRLAATDLAKVKASRRGLCVVSTSAASDKGRTAPAAQETSGAVRMRGSGPPPPPATATARRNKRGERRGQRGQRARRRGYLPPPVDLQAAHTDPLSPLRGSPIWFEIL